MKVNSILITAATVSGCLADQPLPPKLDTHHHFIPQVYRDALTAAGGDPSGWPTPNWSAEASLQNMKSNGIQKAILSLTAPGATIAPDTNSSRALARAANEYAANLSTTYPDSFGFFAALPSLLDVPGTLAEITYALDVLGANGVTLFTRYGDGNNYLGSPLFTPIWEALNARKAIVFIHPTHPQDTNWTNPQLPQPIIDYPHETTRTAVDMIIGDIPRRFPNCTNILSHAGGSLPYLIARVATTSLETQDTKKTFGKTEDQIKADFRSFYYDLALSSSPHVLNMLLDMVPHDHITYGSDFPYADTDKIAGFREELDSYKMDQKLREAIYNGNAKRVLGL